MNIVRMRRDDVKMWITYEDGTVKLLKFKSSSECIKRWYQIRKKS